MDEHYKMQVINQNSCTSLKRLNRVQPKLILVMGVAASGKTTLSKMILQKVWATYLDNNFVVDAFYPHTRTSAEYLKLRPQFYTVLYRIAEENLSVGNSVLLDVPHVKEIHDPAWRKFINKLVAQTNSKLVVIKCVCSEQTLKKRIILRGEERDTWKLDNWDDFLKEQPIDVPVPFDHQDINTEDELSSNVRLAVQHILSEKQSHE